MNEPKEEHLPRKLKAETLPAEGAGSFGDDVRSHYLAVLQALQAKKHDLEVAIEEVTKLIGSAETTEGGEGRPGSARRRK